MKRIIVDKKIKKLLIGLGVYELLLFKNFLIAAMVVPVIVMMNGDRILESFFSITLVSIMALLWVLLPFGLIVTWYLVFSRKADHSIFLVLLVTVPILALLVLGIFLGGTIKPFIPFAFS